MILFIDNFDSFSFNIIDYLKRLGEDVITVRNNVDLDDLANLSFSKVVLSPGPGTPERAGNLMGVINYCDKKAIPTLGICLGHQAIGTYFGAKIIKAHTPMHGKLSVVYQYGSNELFRNIPSSFEVVRYHSLIISESNSEIETLAKDDQGQIMAIKHVSKPFYGIQFHPESVLTKFGLELLSNWVTMSHELRNP